MKPLLRYSAAVAATYFAAWTAAYAFILTTRGDGLDFSHFLEYLRLAWTFRGGELPTFIWLSSIAAFLPLAALVVFLLRRWKPARISSHSPAPKSRTDV